MASRHRREARQLRISRYCIKGTARPCLHAYTEFISGNEIWISKPNRRKAKIQIPEIRRFPSKFIVPNYLLLRDDILIFSAEFVLVPSSKLFPLTVMKIRAAYHCNRMPILFMFRQFFYGAECGVGIGWDIGAWEDNECRAVVQCCKVYG
jgi:hypothetical protein